MLSKAFGFAPISRSNYVHSGESVGFKEAFLLSLPPYFPQTAMWSAVLP
jgi:hypothetical protein